MYAFNISGEMDEMMRRYETIVNAGGTCAMISLNSVGISVQRKYVTLVNWQFTDIVTDGEC